MRICKRDSLINRTKLAERNIDYRFFSLSFFFFFDPTSPFLRFCIRFFSTLHRISKLTEPLNRGQLLRTEIHVFSRGGKRKLAKIGGTVSINLWNKISVWIIHFIFFFFVRNYENYSKLILIRGGKRIIRLEMLFKNWIYIYGNF